MNQKYQPVLFIIKPKIKKNCQIKGMNLGGYAEIIIEFFKIGYKLSIITKKKNISGFIYPL